MDRLTSICNLINDSVEESEINGFKDYSRLIKAPVDFNHYGYGVASVLIRYYPDLKGLSSRDSTVLSIASIDDESWVAHYPGDRFLFLKEEFNHFSSCQFDLDHFIKFVTETGGWVNL